MNEAVLKGFADNELLFDTVRGAILNQFEIDDIVGLQGLDDKQLGEVIRARISGRLKVEAAFKEIASHKTKPEIEKITNQAR